MMTTLQQAHGGPDASYYGVTGDWEIIVTKTRDANVLDRANWDAALDRLTPTGPDTIGLLNRDDWTVETSAHWAVGYIEFIVARPGTQAAYLGACIREELADYPVLDDELHSEYENMATIN